MIKRAFDIITSFLGLIILIPAFLAIAILIKIKMPGPVFFRQKRVGRHGKLFTIYKFRTMVINHQGNSISVKGQDRITALGAILRHYKLDELPELWNVLTGNMSIVGPRPDLPEYLSKLDGEEKLILDLRPGITGLASLKYYNEEEVLSMQDDPQKYNDQVIWPDKVKINLDYYRSMTFIGDMRIIIKTIFRKYRAQ